MYPLDMVSSFTGLSEKQIYRFEKEGILNPKRRSGMKYYSFTDIYVLKLAAILKLNGIPFNNIAKAYDCLKSLKPDRSLSAFTLYHDGKEILDFTDDLTIIASKYGQIVDGKFMLSLGHVRQVAVGTELDAIRRRVLDFTSALKRRRQEVQKKGKAYSLDEIRDLLYG